MSRNFEKTLVQGEVVSNRVLPSLFVFSVVWKVLHDELVDAIQCEPLVLRRLDGHHDKGIVTESWLLMPFLLVFG